MVARVDRTHSGNGLTSWLLKVTKILRKKYSTLLKETKKSRKNIPPRSRKQNIPERISPCSRKQTPSSQHALAVKEWEESGHDKVTSLRVIVILVSIVMVMVKLRRELRACNLFVQPPPFPSLLWRSHLVDCLVNSAPAHCAQYSFVPESSSRTKDSYLLHLF